MKKNRFKSWLIKVLRKWLRKLEPEYGIVTVEKTTVPLVTLSSSLTMPKRRPLPEERINEILARELSEEIIKYANIEWCEKIDMSVFDEQIIYRATVRVVSDK